MPRLLRPVTALLLLLLLLAPSPRTRSGASASAVSPSDDFRAPRLGRACGNDRHGFLPCADGHYCQRVSEFQYVCKPEDRRCRPLHGVRLLGDEVVAFGKSQWRLVPCAIGSCCEHCARLPTCVAFNLEVHPWTAPRCVCRPLSVVRGRALDKSVVAALLDRETACATPRDSVCGFSDGTSLRCCPAPQQCLQVSYERFQCVDPPPECENVRVTGYTPANDLAAANDLSMAECCELCKATRGCTGVNAVFAVQGSSMCNLWIDPHSTDGCPSAARGSCVGHSAVEPPCCPPLSFCQPRNVSMAQCVERPRQCMLQYPKTNLDAADIHVLVGGSVATCCDACRRNRACQAYTFDATDAVCRLKADRLTTRVPHDTAVTGYLNAMYS
ncbi:hypothetical protein PINS_up007050 [Pythium insidiosum]|nr:hypothetical protein PINS_up007050 [Pythium insidiosum]